MYMYMEKPDTKCFIPKVFEYGYNIEMKEKPLLLNSKVDSGAILILAFLASFTRLSRLVC